MKYLYFLSTLLLAVATTAQKCTDSSDFLISGRCFKLVNKQLSYQDARDWCRYSNPVGFTYLATVADPNTDNFLASYARTTFNSNEGSFWIGLTRASTSSKWQWEDGTPVVWTNFQVQNSQKYAAESITNGKWTGYSPDTKMNFVCSYWPGATPGPTPGVETTAPYNWQTTVSESYPTPTAILSSTIAQTIPIGSTITPNILSSTSAKPSCAAPYIGRIVTVFELNAVQAEIQDVVTFVSSNLYNSANYDFTGITQAINIPYAGTDNYSAAVLNFGDAKSLTDLQSNIDTLFDSAVFSTNPTVSDGLGWLRINRDPPAAETNAVIIVVGNHGDDNSGMTNSYIHQLKYQGYKFISVAVGANYGNLTSIADKPEWHFQVNLTNGQLVADQIASILCNLQ